MEGYEVSKLLGRGAFGIAQLAKRRSDGSRVVLKRVELCEEDLQATAADGDKEVKALATCRHPLVVRYFESFQHEDAVVIVMEYVPGGTLRAFLRRQLNLLDEQFVIRVLAQLVSALLHVHARRLLHRDLTSRNILLTCDNRVVKIADFGLSKMLSSRRSRATSVVGTPEYMSPELCRGETYGAPSDVWALGCVLYELLMLRTPFQASTVPTLVLAILRGQYPEPSASFSHELRHLVSKILVPDPARRLTLKQVAASPSVALELIKLSTSLGAVVR
ncbi:hypothetical protein B566_EDAN007358 [Ephemera danica]|nr:hypothetical protein B566_EDAN007358 [Ephemera danica]